MVEVKKYCNLVGCAVVIMTICVPFYFGNLITYTISYLYSQGLYDESNIGDEFWIIAPNSLMYGIGIFISGFLHKKLSIKCSFFFNCSILLTGFLLTYYTVSYSLLSIALTFGCICGVAAGMSYALVIHIVTETFPERVGTATSILMTSFSLGGIFLNALITLVINPENLSPNMELDTYRIFNQTEVIDNVPSTYIYLGIILASVQLLGILLITKPDPTTNYVKLNESPSSSKTFQEVDMTTMEMLKDNRAHMLWFIVCFGVSIAILFQSVYKMFGQTFIDGDQFLATVGSSTALSNMGFRLLIGIAADKCGIKITFLLTYIPSIILLFTIYQVQFLHRIWYLIWVNALSCLLSSVFILIPISIKTMFGSKQFLFKFAVFWNGAGLGAFAIPLTVKYLLTIGWQSLFFVAGGVVSLCTVLVMLLRLPLFPKCKGFSKKTITKDSKIVKGDENGDYLSVFE